MIGILPNGHVIEVEIKITLSDFRADAKKRHRINLTGVPFQFYFLVWPEMVEAVRADPTLPQRSGLLTLTGPDRPRGIVVHRGAEKFVAARKLEAQDWRRAINKQSNAVVSQARKIAELTARLQPSA